MDLSDKEQAIVSGGLAARDLLEHDAFITSIKAIVHDCFQSFVTTQPGEAKQRDDAYYLYRGLQAIEAELLSRVQSMDEIVRRVDARNAENTEQDID